jgi:hypothetical protein
VHPRPPTDDARHDEKCLQRHVCVEFCAEENRTEKNTAANSSPPGMRAVAASENDGQCIQYIGCDFPATTHDGNRQGQRCIELPFRQRTALAPAPTAVQDRKVQGVTRECDCLLGCYRSIVEAIRRHDSDGA